MLAYYRNKQTGEIKPVEQDSHEMFELQRFIGPDNHSLWEQTSLAHVEAVKERAALGALNNEDLGKEHGEAVKTATPGLSIEGVGAELDPHLQLTPGEIEMGLTPKQKQDDLKEMFNGDENKVADIFEEARDLHVPKKDRKDRARQQAKGMRARAGGSDVRENAPKDKAPSGDGGEQPSGPAPGRGDNVVAAQ